MDSGVLTIKELKSESYKCSEQVLSDLKYSLSLGYSVVNACNYCGISTDTYYKWIKLSDEFASFVNKAQDKLINEALKLVNKEIYSGNIKTAIWYLSKRDNRFFKDGIVEEDKQTINKYSIEFVESVPDFSKLTNEEVKTYEMLRDKAGLTHREKFND